MALPINITDLLNKQKIESNCIEFKKGWNPERKQWGLTPMFQKVQLREKMKQWGLTPMFQKGD